MLWISDKFLFQLLGKFVDGFIEKVGGRVKITQSLI